MWDAKGASQMKFPANLRWNDLLDAEIINGELFFVTRNFTGDLSDDSVQITDASWKVLANLPKGRNWFRPIWDVDGQRLIFRQFDLVPQSKDMSVRFRIWDYKNGKDVMVSVQ